ncbi:Ovule protein [Caenorhabditis elegans]|uniref:Ovule protein n=1 Tax=Caenorhabditis elegans TaxID=6239 RepID=Q9XUM3_CAEEL|nr:Ovule protein [Caenorhabditis elegans]CAB04903.4 Ovule protein [Caenorhabditis elegans]
MLSNQTRVWCHPGKRGTIICKIFIDNQHSESTTKRETGPKWKISKQICLL